MQGLWKGVLPSLVMVSNPTVNYVLYEWLLARLAEVKRQRASSPTGVCSVRCPCSQPVGCMSSSNSLDLWALKTRGP